MHKSRITGCTVLNKKLFHFDMLQLLAVINVNLKSNYAFILPIWCRLIISEHATRLIRIYVKTNRNAIRSSNNNNCTTIELCPHRDALTRNKQCKHAIYIVYVMWGRKPLRTFHITIL